VKNSENKESAMTDRAQLDRLTKQLIDDGKLIEAGWVAMRIAAGLINAPPAQLHDMRLAYLAGAQHLFASIITMLDPGAEPTAKDFLRMDSIHHELEAVRAELVAVYGSKI
jgi:hypothetical protein